MNQKFTDIESAREYVEGFMEGFNAKAESRIADKIKTRLSFPKPANVIDESEMLEIIFKSIVEEMQS